MPRRGRNAAPEQADSAPFIDGPMQVLPDKALDSEENRCLAAALTAALPDVQRECVLMYYYLEMSISEIAAALAISESAVKTRLGGAQSAIERGVRGRETADPSLRGRIPSAFSAAFSVPRCGTDRARRTDRRKARAGRARERRKEGRSLRKRRRRAPLPGTPRKKKAGKSPLLLLLAKHRHETFAAVFALVLCSAALIAWGTQPKIENVPDETASAEIEAQTGEDSFSNPWADTDTDTEDAEAGVVLTVHHRVLAARSCPLVTYVSAYDRATGDAIPESELEWSVNRRSLLRFNPDDGSVSIPGDPLGEQGLHRHGRADRQVGQIYRYRGV